ncbi:metal ABC transporter ATP-binding protein [Saliterribacillus persicus]|uniref:Zinc transport system ATP-binding protein n=1 Tax=Saliterribacillus persicus TaxID=930114 RepID=A0A368XLS1_9BACI|nr:metal ABC transporter ATP-binding protein [Saliterribacillus persicus]RCW66984.1 zinc transport system ATP-binding protein [Saliterribacillus persicus]
MSESIVNMSKVTFSYDDKKSLDQVDFNIERGSFIGLVGPNGGGKTTLIKLLLGLEKPNSGEITLFNTPSNKFKDWNKIGYVSQKANSFNRGFPATVEEVVSMGLTSKIGYFKFFRSADRKKVYNAIEQVGMASYLKENVGDLSGGQQQRIFIARALVSNPELLILDEPTVGVDAENVKRFYDLLHHLNEKEGITLLLVTHDIGTMTAHATKVACINKHLHFHGDAKSFQSLDQEALSTIYGHPLQVVTHNH